MFPKKPPKKLCAIKSDAGEHPQLMPRTMRSTKKVKQKKNCLVATTLCVAAAGANTHKDNEQSCMGSAAATECGKGTVQHQQQ